MNVYEAMDQIESIENELMTTLVQVSAEELGLDRRCGRLYLDVDKDFIITRKRSVQKLNYYGGFEYVNEEYITQIGNLICFSRENERVDSHISHYVEQVG